MKKTLIPIGFLGAIAGFVLRKLQLERSYDASGLIPRGDKTSLALYLACAAAAAVILLLCLRERKGDHCEAKKSGLRGFLQILAGLALLSSFLPPMLEVSARLVVPVLAFCAACAMAIEGVYHMNGAAGSLLGGCILPVYLAASLISDYRTWSYNPIVADFCFPLLFLVSAMLASYHLAAFSVGRGKRRTTAFFVGCAMVFAGPVLAAGDWRTILRTAAVCVFLIAELWPYLEKPVRRSKTAAPAASDGAEAFEIAPVVETAQEAIEEIPAEAIEEAAEEIPAEAIEEAAEEIPAEAVDEADEEIPAEAVEEAVEETPAEAVEEAVEEIPAEAVEEAAEEIPAEAVEEAVEEIPAEAVDEAVEEIPAEAVDEAAEEAPAVETVAFAFEEAPAVEVLEEAAETADIPELPTEE